ncbi:hypothetical protein [Escherichia phage vB_EcoM-LTH01]
MKVRIVKVRKGESTHYEVHRKVFNLFWVTVRIGPHEEWKFETYGEAVGVVNTMKGWYSADHREILKEEVI